MALYNNIIEAIGNTPIVKVNKVSAGIKAELFAKLEYFNPMSSVKDRIAAALIETGEEEGKIDGDTHIIEPTSGNTGIGLAFICAVKGYKLTLTMPETMSVERRKILSKLGANIELTDGAGGMSGAVKRAEELAEESGNAFIPQQFKNPANPAVHERTTAEEILRDMEGGPDVFIAGVGTGGTLTGVGRVLKQRNPNVKVIAIEPEESPIISEGKKGPHKIQGIGAGFIPDVLDTGLIDEVLTIESGEAIEMAGRLAKEEGIFCGFSGGAAVMASLDYAAREEATGKRILTVIPDTGERYVSL